MEKSIKSNKTEIFERMPILKALLIMGIPTIISQLITMIYNLADTMLIGKTDDPNKVAAITIVSVSYFILNSFGNLFGVGGSSLLSRLLGQKNEEEARKVGTFSFYGALVLAIVYSLLWLILLDPLVRLLGSTINTHEYAKSYLLWVVVIGGIPSTLALTMSHLIRGTGHAKESGIGLALGGIANIIFDPLFMFVILPPGNEVMGAGIATFLGNFLTFIYFLFVFKKLKDKTVLSLDIRYAKPKKESIKFVFETGLPSCLVALLANTTNIVKNNLISDLGDIETAAFGITQKADMIPLNIAMGICQGMMPLVAYNYASKDYNRMKNFINTSQIISLIISGIFIVACQLFAPQIVSLFIKESQTVELGTKFIRIACLTTPFIAINVQKMYALQSMGKGKEALVLGAIRQGVLAIPALLVLTPFLGALGVISAPLISDGLTFIVTLIIYKISFKKENIKF